MSFFSIYPLRSPLIKVQQPPLYLVKLTTGIVQPHTYQDDLPNIIRNHTSQDQGQQNRSGRPSNCWTNVWAGLVYRLLRWIQKLIHRTLVNTKHSTLQQLILECFASLLNSMWIIHDAFGVWPNISCAPILSLADQWSFASTGPEDRVINLAVVEGGGIQGVHAILNIGMYGEAGQWTPLQNCANRNHLVS